MEHEYLQNRQHPPPVSDIGRSEVNDEVNDEVSDGGRFGSSSMKSSCPGLPFLRMQHGLQGLLQSPFCQSVVEKWFIKEALMLLKLALPLFFWYNFQELPFFIILLFVGHYGGSQELSATALGSAIVNLSGIYVILGLAMAADTLCPQSYGFKNYKRVGVILQRGLLILLLASVPIAVVWLNSESILVLLRQVPCVARLTGSYTRIFATALPALVVYVMLQKYMAAQSLVWVFVVIGLTVNVVLVVSCAVFIAATKSFGTISAAVMMTCISFLSPVLLLVYIRWRKLHVQTWGGWSFECLTEWWQFVRLSLSGLLMVAFEWWSFEISALVTGSIDELQLATNSVLLQLTNLTYTLALGMAAAVNIRVGNELGCGNVMSAKRAAFVSLTLHTAMALVLSLVLFSCRNLIGKIFTREEDVVEEIGDAMIGATGIFFFDQIQGVMWGVMRACGRQATVAVVGFLCFWVLGLPLGITLALVARLSTKGMWIGISIAGCIQTIILGVLLATTNWKKYSDLAMKNARRSTDVAVRPDTLNDIMDKDCAANLTQFISTDEEDACKSIGNESKLTEQCIQSPSGSDLTGQDIRVKTKEEEEEEEEDEGRDVLGNFEDTETLIQATGRSDVDDEAVMVVDSRTLYSTSCRLCQTRASILACRGLLLAMGVVMLAVGLVLVGIIRNHPVGCDQNTTNLTSDSTERSLVAFPIMPSHVFTVVRTDDCDLRTSAIEPSPT